MSNLYNKAEHINEDEGIYTIGDDILDTFMNGNFSQGVSDMTDNIINAVELSDYLNDKAEEYGMDSEEMYYGHFTSDFWIALGREGL